MQGNIDFTGSLSGSIAGGGGGGSDVTITPTLESGTKIADYTIDSESGSLYAPTPVSLTAQLPLSISENIISIDLSDYALKSDLSDYATTSDLEDYQEKLTAGNYISIDSDNEISCTPPITNVWYTPEPGVQQDVLIGKFTVNDVTQNVYAPSGGGVNYSTTEKVIGTWTDGKPLYQKTIEEIFTTSNQHVVTISGVDSTMDCKNYKGRFDYEYNNVFYPSALGANLNMYPADDFSKLKVLSVMTGTFRIRVIITLEYTKTTD